MTEQNDDGIARELAHVVGDGDSSDPIRNVLSEVIGTVFDMLPDGYTRRVVIEEILETEGRIRARLVRRWVN